MKIAHEAPLAIMPDIRCITDYDYALVHLFEDQGIGQEYFEFFKNSLLMGREVILDNSIFELGGSFNLEKFYEWCQKLSPTYYIIPDVLESFAGTKGKFYLWHNLVKDTSLSKVSKSIGVVQGKSFKEAVECYKFWKNNCDKIAISFDYSFYEKLCPHSIKEYSFMYGRQFFIDYLIKENIIDKNKPHHLLGVSLPQEVKHYQNEKYSFIESMDTSNPVLHGYLGIQYRKYGLPCKESLPLYKIIKETISKDKYELILDNVKQFKSFVDGNIY